MPRKPAKALPQSPERSGLHAKRKAAELRAAERAAFVAKVGKGHLQLEDFVEAFESFVAFQGDAGEDYRLERLLDEGRVVVDGLKRYFEHEVTTLQEAFQVHRPPGYRRATARKRFEKMIQLQVDGRILRHHGAKADDALFEALGKMHGVGATQAREWYYERNKGIRPDPARSRAGLPPRFAPYLDLLEWQAA